MKRFFIYLVCAIVFVLLLMQILKPSADTPTNITLDPNTRFQTIDGWAVYPRYWEDDKKGDRFDRSFEPYTEEVSQFLVNQVGINAVRIEIWSGLENPVDYWIGHYQGHSGYKEYAPTRYEKINDNDDPNLANLAAFQFSKFDHRMEKMTLPIKRALDAKGEKLHVNVNYVDFSWGGKMRQGSLSHAENAEEFAEFVLVYFNRLRDKYGIQPDSFELILEPENTKHWRGKQIGQGLVAVARRLKEHGFNTEIIAPSNTSMRNTIKYFDKMIEQPNVLDYLDTIAYHRYHFESISMLETIRARAEQYQLKTAMLEKIDAGIEELFQDLTIANVSSWQQWAAAGRLDKGDGGGHYALVDTKKEKSSSVSMAKLSYQLSQVFLYVRRGAVRIATSSDNADKTSVAFINSDGDWVVIVRAEQVGGQVTINDLPVGRYGMRFVDDQQQIEMLPAVSITKDQALIFDLERSGVMTIYEMDDSTLQ